MAVARRKMRSPLGAIPSCPFFVSYHESRSALVANSILVNFREGFHPPFLSFNSEFHELFLIIYYRNTISTRWKIDARIAIERGWIFINSGYPSNAA